MGVIADVAGAAGSALLSTGRVLLHTKYPDEIEYYAITLELTDSYNRTIETLTFPILPQSISFNAPNVANIKRSMGGIVVLDTPTYTPSDLNLSGTFGRAFKYMFGRGELTQKGEALHLGKNRNEFSRSVKNGYGITKTLEYMIRRAQEVDSRTGQTNRLFLYNLTLNNHYLVQPVSIQLNQDVNSNMIWNYNLQFRTLAYAYYVRTEAEVKKHLTTIMNRSVVSRLGTRIAQKVGSIVASRIMNTAMALSNKTDAVNFVTNGLPREAATGFGLF